MSVLIKGLEMPTHCIDCPFMVSRDDDDCILQSDEANANFENWKQMKAGCPLVPVPPHGRLGDLDNLALLVLNWISTQEKAYPHEDSNALAWRLGAKAMANQIYRDVKAYPTIIEAEEDA